MSEVRIESLLPCHQTLKINLYTTVCMPVFCQASFPYGSTMESQSVRGSYRHLRTTHMKHTKMQHLVGECSHHMLRKKARRPTQSAKTNVIKDSGHIYMQSYEESVKHFYDALSCHRTFCRTTFRTILFRGALCPFVNFW